MRKISKFQKKVFRCFKCQKNLSIAFLDSFRVLNHQLTIIFIRKWARKGYSLTTAKVLRAPWLCTGKKIDNNKINLKKSTSQQKNNSLIKGQNQAFKNGSYTKRRWSQRHTTKNRSMLKKMRGRNNNKKKWLLRQKRMLDLLVYLVLSQKSNCRKN